MVDHVREVDPVVLERGVEPRERLPGREVPRDADAAERVTDDQVETVGREVVDRQPAVLDTDLGAVGEVVTQQLGGGIDHASVDLGDAVVGAGTRGGDIARQRERACAEVVRVDGVAPA